MDIISYETHTGPGRRFSAGTTRGDHIVGTHGFVAHMTLFLALGAMVFWLWPVFGFYFMIVNAILAAILLVIRGKQVGSTTTKESIKAIKDAWSKNANIKTDSFNNRN